MKDVHHEIHVIQQHPPTLCEPLDMMWHDTTRRQRVHEVLRHAPHVGVRGARHDDEVIGGRRQAAQIEHHRVDRLAVGERGRYHSECGQRVRPRTPHRAPAPSASHSAPVTRLFRPPAARYSFTTVTWISGRTSGCSLIPTRNSPSSRIGSGRSTRRLSTLIPSSSSLRWMSLAVTDPYNLSSSPTFTGNVRWTSAMRPASVSAAPRSAARCRAIRSASCAILFLFASVAG